MTEEQIAEREEAYQRETRRRARFRKNYGRTPWWVIFGLIFTPAGLWVTFVLAIIAGSTFLEALQTW